MIKPDIREFEIPNRIEIPDHWRVQTTEKRKIQHSNKRIIPIGYGDDSFRKILIHAIKNAKETIMLCSFILSDEKLIEEIIEATGRNVRCYLLFSTNAQLEKEHKVDKTEFDRKSLESHKRMLDKLVGKALARTNDHLHAKYMIVDHGTPSQKGFLSTANFTYEALTRNQEIGVVLEEREILELFEFFRLGFWTESNQELVRINSWDDVKQKDIQENQHYTCIRTTSGQSVGIKKALQDSIQNAKDNLFVASYGFDNDHTIVQRLQKYAKISNKLVILTRPRERNSLAIKNLANAGAIILSYDYLHAKFVYTPNGNINLIMTANIEPRGLDTGYEVGILLNKKDKDEFERILSVWIKSAPLKWERGGKIQNLKPGKIRIPKGYNFEEKEIIVEYGMPEIERTARDLALMKELMKTSPEKGEVSKNLLPQVLKVKRIINPPKIPQNAVKIKAEDYWRQRLSKKELKEKKIQKFPIQVYKHKKRFYGVVKSWKEFEEVKESEDLPKGLIFVTK